MALHTKNSARNFLALNSENVGKKRMDRVALLQIDTLVVSEKNWNTKENKSMMHVLYVVAIVDDMCQDLILNSENAGL